VDFSDHVTNFTLTQQADQLEVTAMGDTAHKFVTGLSADTITVTLLNDTAAGSILATLQAAYGTSVTALVVPDKGSGSTTISATNPLYTVSILINNLTPVGAPGTPADYARSSMTFTCTSSVAYATTGTW
jgi:kynureninase